VPPLSIDELKAIEAAYQSVPKAVLVHCNAGLHRAGVAVEYLAARSA
jgi:protein tyrosine/serine phosphatase